MSEKIYIAGAHSRAQTLAVYLQYLYPDIQVEAYLYDNDEENPERIGTVPVLRLDENVCLNITYSVYIGTRGVYHKKFMEIFKKAGFKKIYPVTAELDLELRNAFLKKYFLSKGQEFYKIDTLRAAGSLEREEIDAAVYVVKSNYDRPLVHKYELAPYEREIQAGAELAAGTPDGLADNIGDNISAKNRQYCELTAIYWIWKHAKERIIGLAHYRRHFILPPEWGKIMQYHGIDVILPLPLYVVPNIAQNYKQRHDPCDWEFLMRYLEEKDMHTYQDVKVFFSSNLYSPCNMFIMKKEILNELCAWLFPILDAVVLHGGQREDCYLNRYPGFLSERLMTYFFLKNGSKYKVVYADKNFLV